MSQGSHSSRHGKFRPVLTLVLVTLSLVVGWVGLEVYFAFTAKPNPTVDYMKLLSEHAEAVQGDGENAWELIGEICQTHAEALEVFEDSGTPFGDLSIQSGWWFQADVSLLEPPPEDFNTYIEQMKNDGMTYSEADALHRQAQELYTTWLKQWSTSPDWSRVMVLRQVTRVSPPAGDADELIGHAMDRGIYARKLSRSLNARQVLARNEQNWTTYVECYDASLALGWSLAIQPVLVQRLVASLILRNAMRQVADDADNGLLPDEVTDELLRLTEARRIPDRMYTIRGERLFTLDSIQMLHDQRGRRILGGPHAIPEFDWGGMGSTQPSSFQNIKSIFYPRHGSVVRDAEQIFQDIESYSTRPVWEQYEHFGTPDFAAMFLSGNSTDLTASLRTIASPLPDTIYDFSVVSCRMALAISKYNNKHGHPPDYLEELVPDYIDAVPIDPFSREGKPFEIRVRRWFSLEDRFMEGYLLYSVGLDGVDDGAKLPPDAMSNSLRPEHAGTDYILNDPDWR